MHIKYIYKEVYGRIIFIKEIWNKYPKKGNMFKNIVNPYYEMLSNAEKNEVDPHVLA